MNAVYLGIKNHVVCIERDTGRERWRKKLESGLFAITEITTILPDGDKIFAYTGGHLYCLNAQTGHQLWKNELEDLGHGMAILGSDSQMAVQASAETQASAMMVAVTAATAGAIVSGGGDGGGC